MAKPGKKTTERNIFTEIELKIMLLNERIKNHEKSIEKAKKMSGWNGPAGVSGIDYSREPVAGVHISFAEGLRMIELDETRIRELKAERADLRRRKKRIEKIYESLDGAEAQVYGLYTMSHFMSRFMSQNMSQNMSWKCRVKVFYNGISGNYAKARFQASPAGGAFSIA